MKKQQKQEEIAPLQIGLELPDYSYAYQEYMKKKQKEDEKEESSVIIIDLC
jgi:hypothetical protein